jgi:hypothetical protein
MSSATTLMTSHTTLKVNQTSIPRTANHELCHHIDDIAHNIEGSPPNEHLLQTLKPGMWFSVRFLHVSLSLFLRVWPSSESYGGVCEKDR